MSRKAIRLFLMVSQARPDGMDSLVVEDGIRELGWALITGSDTFWINYFGVRGGTENRSETPPMKGY